MKVVLLSNYLNHHQLPICLEFVKQTNNEFIFIATQPISKERLDFGYVDMNKQYPWVLRTYESQEQLMMATEQINNADVVILGNAPKKLIVSRLKQKKLTFLYSERIYKKEPAWYKLIIYGIKHFIHYKRYRSLYMLCASMYTASDYAKTNSFTNKCFKWGYFPDVKESKNTNDLIELKQKNSIVWAGRFIDWKHPEFVLMLAKKLKEEGYNFSVKMIGSGELFSTISSKIEEYNLVEEVELTGSINPNQVRVYMENSEIHIFTSDRNEGWGAVLNEAMNSACVSVCSNAIGSSGFLIDNGKNGYLYDDGDFDDFYQKVKMLIDNSILRKNMALNAYYTMEKEWNATNAVEKFLKTCNNYIDKGIMEFLFDNGVLSKAK